MAERGVDKVFVLHDFDVSGFSIFGTLGSHNRRYQFSNQLNLIDLGLRLADIRQLGLEFEQVETSGDWDTRAATLADHGATDEEIEILRHDRVELNAMSSGVFIAFLERKLTEHGVNKVVPPDDVMVSHARNVVARALTNRALETIRKQAELDAAAIKLPADLHDRVAALLEREPDLPWDLAVARIVKRTIGDTDNE